MLEAVLFGVAFVFVAGGLVTLLSKLFDHGRAFGWFVALVLIGIWAAGAYYN
jgi:hypothetical protein